MSHRPSPLESALAVVGVLLVEDDPDDLTALEAVLMGPGLDLVRTSSADSALAQLRERDFAVVVVDLDADGLDGFAFAQQVRSNPRTRETPLIFVSGGSASDFPVTAAYRLGVVDYLIKPVLADIFRAKVTTFADLFRKTERLRALDRREGERRVAEADLRANTILESISDGFFSLDRDWKFVYVNRRAEAYLGQTRADLLGRVLWDAIPESKGSVFEPEYRRAVATGQAVTVEAISPLSGRWIEVHGYPSDEGLSVYFRDVSDRRALQDTLRESEARLRSVTEAIPQLVWTAVPDGGVEYCNHRWLAFTGLNSDEVQGTGWLRAMHPADRPAAWKLWQNCVATGCDYEQEQRIRRADGAYLWFLTRATPLRDESGRIERWYGTCTDIEDRKRAEAGLARLATESDRERRFIATVLANTADFIYTFDLAGRFTFVNNALLSLWGKCLPEALGKNFFELDYPPELAEKLQLQIQQVIDNRAPLRDETPYTSAVGERQYEYIFVPVIGVDGTVESVAGSTRDVTERKRAEAELKQQDRRKDEFLATLAHELRNPLAPIRNAIEVLRLSGKNPAATEHAVGVLDRQTRQLTRLVDDLLDVSRVSSGKLELRRSRVELAAIVPAAVEASRPLVEGRGHSLAVELPTEPVWLDADAARLSQVFSNLLNNAAKYTEPGGRIRLTATLSPGFIKVAITDNGVGLDAELLPKVFDAFVQADRSLSKSGGGLGLGLTLVRKLVEMHGGTVSAHSDGPGHGSRFAVTLPTVDPIPSPTAPVSAAKKPSTNGRRVLVVEDNRDGAESLRVLLELVGHEVRIAHTGPDGVTAAKTFCPEVVLCDLGLPGMSGYDVARTIRSDPTIASAVLVCVSGYGQERDRRQAIEAGFDQALVKPVDPEMLVRIVAGG